MSLTSAFTVLGEEVRRSEVWKLTCRECKVNIIRAGKRKQSKRKQNESNNEKKNRSYWGFVVVFENLGLPFGNVFNKGKTNTSEM